MTNTLMIEMAIWRTVYPDATFTDLYNEVTMLYDLCAAQKKTTALLPSLMTSKIF